jgi:hypothetical protein
VAQIQFGLTLFWQFVATYLILAMSFVDSDHLLCKLQRISQATYIFDSDLHSTNKLVNRLHGSLQTWSTRSEHLVFVLANRQ